MSKRKVLPKKYLKDDLLYIAKSRNSSSDITIWKKKKMSELKEELLPLSKDEDLLLAKYQNERLKFKDVKKEILKKTLMVNGFGKSSGLSKNGMIDNIIKNGLKLYKKIQFDADQKALFNRIDESLVIICSGPGAGKTSSLSKLASMITVKYPKAKILIIMFNVAAEASMKTRIESMDVPVLKISNFNPWKPLSGIQCLTFNKLAYRIINPGEKGSSNSHWMKNLIYSKADIENIEADANGEENLEVDVPVAGVSSVRVDVNLQDQISEATSILEKKPLLNAFDYVLIDEAQDVTGKQVDFIQNITKYAKNIFICGDPRQELYPGARWFSNLWTETEERKKHTMHFNHRSHPEIINMLNIFSEWCFSSLHHKQISSTAMRLKEDKTNNEVKLKLISEKTEKAIQVLSCDKDDIPFVITTELLKYKPSDVYIICPITIEKFGIENILMEVRNNLAEAKSVYPLQQLKEDVKYDPSASVYVVGSAKKLKGTEKPVVIILGAEIPYLNYGVDHIDLCKSLFVCLSRPIKRCLIIVDKKQKIDELSPLGQVIKCDPDMLKTFKFERSGGIIRKTVCSSKIKDDLSDGKTISIKYKSYAPLGVIDAKDAKDDKYDKNCPKLASDVMRVKFSEDFVGLFIEALFAIKLGVKVDAWIKIIKNPSTNLAVLTQQESNKHQGNYLQVLPDQSYQLLLKYGEKHEIPPDLLVCDNMAYILTVLNYSSQVGKFWIASREVLDAANLYKDQLDDVLGKLIKYLNLGKHRFKSWGETVLYNVPCVRSKKFAGSVIGVADLLFNDLVLEIKFAMHKDSHIRQTSIYSAILGVPGLLVNILEGQAYKVQPASKKEVDEYARAMWAIKNGKSKILGERITYDIPNSISISKHEKSETSLIKLKKGLEGSVLVCLDVETYGMVGTSPLMETSAVAFYFGTEEIEGTFSEISEACQILPIQTDSHGNEIAINGPSISGLAPLEDISREELLAAENKLKKKAQKWLASIKGRVIGLVWGCCDDFTASGILGDDDSEDDSYNVNPRKNIHIIDVHQLYKKWLILNACNRKGNTKLRDAVEHLFPSGFNWRAHASFDDVVATMMVFNAIIKFSGKI